MKKFTLFFASFNFIFFSGLDLRISGTCLAQSYFPLHSDLMSDVEPECLYENYRFKLDSYILNKQSALQSAIKPRSSGSSYDLRIYVDTSYERRRVGNYNNNDSVRNFLMRVVDSAKWMFNLAAPNWDLDFDTEVIFFDAATPFSYGADASETLINFYDWIENQNFPGLEDNYVLYSGNYTNQGVSFLAALCFPGASMVGYISSFNPNVDLASHEWIGHSANSLHYNLEINIMNSFANRPWNAPSLSVIENFLDNQLCMMNFQSPLALDFLNFNAEYRNGSVQLNWQVNAPSEVHSFIIERSNSLQLWQEIGQTKNQYSWTDIPSTGEIYYYRISALTVQKKHLKSRIRKIHFGNNQTVYVHSDKVQNPFNKQITICDIYGRQLLQSNEQIIDLEHYRKNNVLFIQFENQVVKWPGFNY